MAPLVRVIGALATLCIGLLEAGATYAGGLSVAPTRLDFSGPRAVQAILLTNLGSQAISVEAQILPWPEDDPDAASGDLAITPPILTLQPNQRVRVRIGLVKRLGGEKERAYRIYFTELASPQAPNANAIDVRLRIGVPIFVAPDQPHAAPLSWKLLNGEHGPELQVSNPGNVHVPVNQIVLMPGGPSAIPVALRLPYVLAGQTESIPLSELKGLGAVAGQNLQIKFQSGDASQQVNLSAP